MELITATFWNKPAMKAVSAMLPRKARVVVSGNASNSIKLFRPGTYKSGLEGLFVPYVYVGGGSNAPTARDVARAYRRAVRRGDL